MLLLPSDMVLSLVVPAFNEAGRIEATLRDALAYLGTHAERFEILVVDDGSTDNTAGVVARLAEADERLRCLSLPQNRGKGAAVRAGMLAAVGHYVVFTDADGSTPIFELAPMLARLQAGADVVIGSRALPGSDVRTHQQPLREWLGRRFNQLLRTLLLTGF
ncbi:MAG: glycosyltransferase, partial [Myxococcales bacterium]|nr:glycosyltransferase [Myxococcales bacterium]